jgi:hypothetical protein
VTAGAPMPGTDGYLKIKDRTFAVAKAYVCGHVNTEGLSWSVSVDCEDHDFDGETWSPRAYLESVPWNVRCVEDFKNTPIIIANGATFGDGLILPDSVLCCLYVFEHQFLRDSRTLLQKIAKNQFRMRWTAICDVFFDDEYNVDLPLQIETTADFLGLSTWERDESKARSHLARNFDDSEVVFDPTPQYDVATFTFRE